MSISSFFFIFILLSLSSAEYPLYIDELEDLVVGPDRRLLDILDDDDYMPRNKVYEKFKVILDRQNEETKNAYQQLVKIKEDRRLAQVERELKYLTAEERKIYHNIRSIRADLSISEKEAKIKEEEQLRKIRYDSSSEEDDD